jgi:hypothetical protein
MTHKLNVMLNLWRQILHCVMTLLQEYESSYPGHMADSPDHQQSFKSDYRYKKTNLQIDWLLTALCFLLLFHLVSGKTAISVNSYDNFSK